MKTGETLWFIVKANDNDDAIVKAQRKLINQGFSRSAWDGEKIITKLKEATGKKDMYIVSVSLSNKH